MLLSVSMSTQVYIAGPMTGIPELNYPLFNDVEQWLLSYGYSVQNPATNNVVGYTGDALWREYMRLSLRQISYCDAVVLLPGWEKSKGASLEKHIADAMGLKTMELSADWCNTDECAALDGDNR